MISLLDGNVLKVTGSRSASTKWFEALDAYQCPKCKQVIFAIIPNQSDLSLNAINYGAYGHGKYRMFTYGDQVLLVKRNHFETDYYYHCNYAGLCFALAAERYGFCGSVLRVSATNKCLS